MITVLRLVATISIRVAIVFKNVSNVGSVYNKIIKDNTTFIIVLPGSIKL